MIKFRLTVFVGAGKRLAFPFCTLPWTEWIEVQILRGNWQPNNHIVLLSKISISSKQTDDRTDLRRGTEQVGTDPQVRHPAGVRTSFHKASVRMNRRQCFLLSDKYEKNLITYNIAIENYWFINIVSFKKVCVKEAYINFPELCEIWSIIWRQSQ